MGSHNDTLRGSPGAAGASGTAWVVVVVTVLPLALDEVTVVVVVGMLSRVLKEVTNTGQIEWDFGILVRSPTGHPPLSVQAAQAAQVGRVLARADKKNTTTVPRVRSVGCVQ